MVIQYKLDIQGVVFETESFEELIKTNNYDDIIYIYCSDNILASLPNLPKDLTHLYCSDNKLTFLPNLPKGLTHLVCYNNNLTTLPTLPTDLIQLCCSYNQLKVLPNLPKGLLHLNCYHNNLTFLPKLKDGLENSLYYHNPICKYILEKCNSNVDIYHRENEIFSSKLVRWYLDCRENPAFKFCRDRINLEYDSLLGEEDSNRMLE